MKKFILYTIIFFGVVFIVDTAFGYACRYLNSHAKGGDTKNHYDIAMNMKADVLIFGSSRCIHHYVPSILEDSLEMRVYNCGVDGNGILYQYSRLHMILNRFTPKIIIYDICPSFDIIDGDNSKYLGRQKSFYSIPGVSEVFEDINPMEKYKMYSNLYQYNTIFIPMLSDNVHPQQKILNGGYKPLQGEIGYEPVKEKEKVKAEITWDPLKQKYFEKFYKTCKEKGIVFIVSFSPLYRANSNADFKPIIQFCKNNNVLLIDNYTNPVFSEKREYFVDSSHMNDTGAKAFTTYFISQYKDTIINSIKR